MAVENTDKESSDLSRICSIKQQDDFEISSSWQITNDRHFCDTVSTVSLSQASKRITLEDVVSLDTCIRLQSKEHENESCTVDIKLKNNQRIAGIAVVSEALILEFYKQFGEYKTTVFAEFIDEFEDNSVYLAEVSFELPTPEASIKFAKLKDKESLMWLYGIRLVLTEPVFENKQKTFNYDIINNILQNCNNPKTKGAEMAKLLQFIDMENSDEACNVNACLGKLMQKSLKIPKQQLNKSKTESECDGKSAVCIHDSLNENKNLDFKRYIDDKFKDMEERLMYRIDTLECNVNQRLDTILKRFHDPFEPNESTK